MGYFVKSLQTSNFGISSSYPLQLPRKVSKKVNKAVNGSRFKYDGG